MSNISETLKVADFIINSESGMAYGSINEEGKYFKTGNTVL